MFINKTYDRKTIFAVKPFSERAKSLGFHNGNWQIAFNAQVWILIKMQSRELRPVFDLLQI